VAVSDTGNGMDAATRERVFEPFFTTKPIGSGTGLGLATVHGIVKQSGGNVWVYSEPGNGTTFKIYLPGVSADITTGAGEHAPAALASGTETVLVVEDEPSLRNLVAEILELQGYEVIVAANPVEALEIVAVTPGIDLLLTDLIMPGFNGRELAEQVTELLPSAGILFMSGYADEAVTRNGALELGAAYLEKPFSAADLGKKVRAILDARTVVA
jgi:two-component system cell cycle sensor histidine kinase/response regulator CckA